MIRIVLTPEQRAAVTALRRDSTLRPAERDRLEMLSLSEAGWAAPRIAAHLGYHTATVRRFFHAFESSGAAAAVRRFFHAFEPSGVAAVRRDRPGPPPDAARRAEVGAVLTELLHQPRA